MVLGIEKSWSDIGNAAEIEWSCQGLGREIWSDIGNAAKIEWSCNGLRRESWSDIGNTVDMGWSCKGFFFFLTTRNYKDLLECW